MALKRRNAEASKDAAVRFLYLSLYSFHLTNTLSGRVRQHPPQACCRGQEPAAGDEEASCFLHAQVNLPSQRRIGWVKLQGRLAEDTQDTQVRVYRSRVTSMHYRLRGSRDMVVSMECPMKSHRGHTKAFRSPFFDKCSLHIPIKRSLKKLLTNFHVFKIPYRGLCRFL
jgi:hypothetical protein